MVAKFAEINQLRERYYHARNEGKGRAFLKEVKRELAQLQKSLKDDWKLWDRLSRSIMRMQPLEIQLKPS